MLHSVLSFEHLFITVNDAHMHVQMYARIYTYLCNDVCEHLLTITTKPDKVASYQ